MHKYLTIIIVTVIFALTGCQKSGPMTMNHLFTPQPAPMTLSQSVEDALINSNDPVIANVRVEAVQQVIILSGYVKKIRQSDTAEQIARQVPGVQNVDNRLIVRQ